VSESRGLSENGTADGAAVGSREEGTARGARATAATSDADRDASQRKERVLHTRVPAVLEAELKRFADSLRVPVSNLVRTILEDALSVADAASESVEARLKLAAHQLEFERERLKRRVVPDPLKDVFAFQPVTLAQTCFCAKCSERLAPGTSAHMGLVDSPSGNPRPRIFVCDSCLPKS
jgi:hypothetical protein